MATQIRRYQEYFMGPLTDVKVEIIEEYSDYTFLAKIDGIEKHVRISPYNGEFVIKPAGKYRD